MTRQHDIVAHARRAQQAAAVGDREVAWEAWAVVRRDVHAILMELRVSAPADAAERLALSAALIEVGTLYGAEEWVAAGKRLGA